LKNKITDKFTVNIQQSVFADDYTRFFITEDELFLKIEFVNDVSYYPGEPINYKFGKIDTPINILSNKLTALIGRDEPKDIFDIIHLSLNFSFNWLNIFEYAKQKAVINELDVEQRLVSFPVEWLESVNWLNKPVNIDKTRKILNQIADDFLLGKTNSLGIKQTPIGMAIPFSFD
jgi:hypothetical protein